MRLRTRASLLGGLATLGLLLAGCGSSSISGALSSSQNKAITGDLYAVGQSVSGGSCSGTQSALSKLDATLSGLPSQTNASLVSNLRQGASTLRGLALKECHGTQTTTSSSSSTSTTTTTTSTTPTTTTSTTSTPTTTTTQTQTVTTTSSAGVPGTGGVTTLQSTTSSATTNGGGGLNAGGGAPAAPPGGGSGGAGPGGGQ